MRRVENYAAKSAREEDAGKVFIHFLRPVKDVPQAQFERLRGRNNTERFPELLRRGLLQLPPKFFQDFVHRKAQQWL
jgi:hypothetical protein